MGEQEDFRAAMAEAIALQKSGDTAAAARVYRTLLERAPKLVPVLCLLANLERQHGDFERATGHLQRAREQTPEAPAVLLESGLLALAMDRPEEALPHLRRLTEVRPGYPDGHFNLGHALERSQKPEQAIAAYEQALAQGVSDPWEAQTRIGSCLVALGREREAVEHFDQALAMAPAYAAALFGKGMVRVAYGDFEQAGSLFEDALRADPACIEAYQQLVELRRFTSMDEPVVRSIKALLRAPDASEHAREKLHFALGKVANDCGAFDEAFGHYASAKALKKKRQPPFARAAFDELLRRIEATFTRLPASAPGFQDDGFQPVFIIGMPRSGTSLVEQILSSHSLVGGAGELAFMEALSRKQETGYPEAVVAADEEWRRASRTAYLRELSSFADAGLRYVTDKYPANFLHVGLIASLFPEARFIHCRRNSLDNCLSIFFQDFSTGNYYANDLEDIAFYYSGYARLMKHWMDIAGARLHTVQYETVVENQERETRKMLDFLGLEWEARCLRFHENPRKVATMSRWQVRQPVYAGSSGRWRNYEDHIGALIGALPPES